MKTTKKDGNNSKTKSQKSGGVNKFNKWVIVSLILFLALVSSIFGEGFGIKNILKGSSSDKVAEATLEFINQKFFSDGASASLVESLKANGLYKIKFKVDEQEFESYVSSDGKILFPQGIPIEEAAEGNEENEETGEKQEEEKITCDDIEKVDKPSMEAFVVSECPYGLQMQRVLNEIVKNIPSMASQIEVRYIGTIEDGKVTSMHGEKEAQENLRQICIREEQADKYWNYIGCYISNDCQDEECINTNRDKCLDESQIDRTGLDVCMSDNSKGMEYAKEDFSRVEKYKANGSPAIIMNGGQSVDEEAFANGMELEMRSAELIKNLLCCSFQEKPENCAKELNKVSAASSFSETYDGTCDDGTCQ